MSGNTDSRLETKEGLAADHLESEDDVYVFPCSVVQRTCWFLEQMSPGTAVNNIAVRFRLTGNVRPELLEQALSEIALRQEVLRTRFIVRNGEPMQLIEPNGSLKLHVIDLTADPAAAERVASEEARLAFDIEKGPLWRARLLCTGPQEFILLITIHHIIADGWSIGIITDELGQIYGALAEGAPLLLPPLSIQYADYASWQNETLRNKLEAELEYWRRQLHDFQPLCIPTDFARPLKAVNQGKIQSVVLPRLVTDSLKRLSEQQGCTLFTTMLAAFQSLMRHESGQTDIVVRTQTAGRARVELEPVIGWFVNSLLLRVEVPTAASFLDLLKETQQVVVEALDHQDIPFEHVIEVARPSAELSHHPPFQVNFIFQRDFVKQWIRGGVTLTAAPSAAAGTFADLNFFLVERADGWRASVDVNLDVFSPETGDLFLRKYQTVLEAVARNPAVFLSDIPLPPPRTAQHDPRLHPRAAAVRSLQPRDELETELLSIWKDVLGCDSLEVDTNFFDVGGHSLLAVRMLSIVQKRFGHRINLSGLFAEPTVLAMARALRLQASEPAGVSTHRTNGSVPKINVITIQPHGDAAPFFMVGGDHWFRPLANRLGPNQPFLGLSLNSYEQRAEPTPFEEIAADLTKVILNIRKSGPILLGGWCVDGAVAFEVARQLSRANHEIGVLVLIDAINPAYRRKFRSRPQRLRRTLKGAKSLSDAVALARNGLTLAVSWARRSLAPASAEPEPEFDPCGPARQEIRRLLDLAETQYTPGPISCPVVLLRAEVQPFQDPDLGWKKLTATGFETVEIPADHYGMFREPDVELLSTALGRCIGRALEKRT